MTAELYGVVNVPEAVWIDESGRIVIPAETAGSSDAFRTQLDRATKQMSAQGLAERERVRGAYLHALRDWAARGRQAPTRCRTTRRVDACRSTLKRTRTRQPTSALASTSTPADTRGRRRPTWRRRAGCIPKAGA